MESSTPSRTPSYTPFRLTLAKAEQNLNIEMYCMSKMVSKSAQENRQDRVLDFLSKNSWAIETLFAPGQCQVIRKVIQQCRLSNTEFSYLRDIRNRAKKINEKVTVFRSLERTELFDILQHKYLRFNWDINIDYNRLRQLFSQGEIEVIEKVNYGERLSATKQTQLRRVRKKIRKYLEISRAYRETKHSGIFEKLKKVRQ